MKNMIRMRDDQFNEGVRRSLYAVSSTLEQDETRYYLEEDVAAIESTIYSQVSGSPSQKRGSYSLTMPDGLQADVTIRGNTSAQNDINRTNAERYRNMQETLKGQYLYQKGLLDEVILNILSQSSNRPIQERADSATVASYWKSKLETTGPTSPLNSP